MRIRIPLSVNPKPYALSLPGPQLTLTPLTLSPAILQGLGLGFRV